MWPSSGFMPAPASRDALGTDSFLSSLMTEDSRFRRRDKDTGKPVGISAAFSDCYYCSGGKSGSAVASCF